MIYFSIVMATYNSEKTIEKSLRSIRGQDFDQSQIEILVVDGGSTDRTREIAKKYGALILENPARLPEAAKMIGLKHATGKYLCIMDSDEVIGNRKMMAKRKAVLEKYPKLKCLAIGLSTPKDSDPCCYYINSVGDPFSCFVYQTFQSSMEGLIIKKGRYDSEKQCYVAYYDYDEIKPIGDSGTVMDLDYLKEKYSEKFDELTTSSLFDLIITDSGYVGYIKGDKHLHYTSSSFATFFKKLKFRIVNNIFDIKGSGYSNKAQNNKRLCSRKYLYPFYTLTTIVPIFDGIRMSLNYRHWIFLLHPLFCWYVLVEIIYQYGRKILGMKSRNESYAK